ncbi:MAG: hypothetical protein JXP73_04120 [Deltaproteobacteria bacterium]|nr:hypothetical protein [Deltaproteobacteria bacterium]
MKEVEDRGGISNRTNAGDLFTLRFAWELALACPDGDITYEFRAGVGMTSVDFRLQTGIRTWLIECLAINPSAAAQRLEKKEQIEPGICVVSLAFSENAENRCERPEAQLHRAYQAIWQHVWNQQAQRHAKFPARSQNSANVLVVSIAGLWGWAPAVKKDCIEIVHGSRKVLLCPEAALQGLFDGKNAEPGAIAVRDRVDLMVFVDDVHGIYDDQEIRRSSYLLRNPASEPWVETEYPVLLPASLRNPLHSRD